MNLFSVKPIRTEFEDYLYQLHSSKCIVRINVAFTFPNEFNDNCALRFQCTRNIDDKLKARATARSRDPLIRKRSFNGFIGGPDDSRISIKLLIPPLRLRGGRNRLVSINFFNPGPAYTNRFSLCHDATLDEYRVDLFFPLFSLLLFSAGISINRRVVFTGRRVLFGDHAVATAGQKEPGEETSLGRSVLPDRKVVNTCSNL